MDLIRAGNAGRRGWAWAVLLTLVFVMGVLSGCGKQGPDIDLADIDISEIDKIEHTGTTGGKDGGFSYTFSEKEQLVMEYVHLVTKTPVIIPEEIVTNLHKHFSERGIVIIASTIAQVNYWARLIRSLGIPVAGFGDICRIEKA